MAHKVIGVQGWVRRFRRAGFIVEMNGGHWKVRNADRAGPVLVTFGNTPSDKRWEHYLRRSVRKRGLDLTPRRPANRQLSLTRYSDVEREGAAMAKTPLADLGRTVAARAKMREKVDEINSLLPGHTGAYAHIARELKAFGDERRMQTWPNTAAGSQTLRTMYTEDKGGFAVWVIELVEAGLDSVGMPDPKPRKPKPKPDSVPPPPPLPEVVPAPAGTPAQNGAVPAVASLEIFYRLVKGGMPLDDAYAVARVFRPILGMDVI